MKIFYVKSVSCDHNEKLWSQGKKEIVKFVTINFGVKNLKIISVGIIWKRMETKM